MPITTRTFNVDPEYKISSEAVQYIRKLNVQTVKGTEWRLWNLY